MEFLLLTQRLTQLVLGADRDSGDLAKLFDERDPAVRSMVTDAIGAAHSAGIKIGICGQAPSNYPDFASFIVHEHIDSISLNADSFIGTLRHVALVEEAMEKVRRLENVDAG